MNEFVGENTCEAFWYSGELQGFPRCGIDSFVKYFGSEEDVRLLGGRFIFGSENDYNFIS